MSLRLLRVELRRFFARRAIVVSLLTALLLALVVNIVQLARSARTVVSVGPVTGLVQDRRIDIARTFSGTVLGVGIALTLLVAFLSATFVAADFGTSIATQLVFEPRRWRVYLTKTLAVAIGCAVVAFIVLVWCGALQYAGSSMRGITTGVNGAWLRNRAGDIGRAVAGSAMMAAIAFAIGAVTRKTAAAVGTLFGLLIALQFVRRNFRTVGRLSPVNAVWAFVDGLRTRNDDFV
ncbi:MAG TPA: hypothetical protein VGI86_16940 [Acidimicrobiia bacterium]